MIQWPIQDCQKAQVRIHWDKATGFVQDKSTETLQQPLTPDTYFLPQYEPNSMLATSHNDETGLTNNDSMSILPQGKMGSMMDVQSLTYECTNIGSDNEHISDHQLASEHNNDHVGGPKQHQPSTVLATPGGLQGAEPMLMCTWTPIIRPPEQFRNDVAFVAQEAWDDLWGVHDFQIQQDLQDPIAFAVTSNPDTMYYSEALRAPDWEQFITAMKKEVLDHETRYHWELVPHLQVPEGTIILPAVWSMERKWRILTNEVYKWKARLNMHGGKQIKNVH